MSKIAGEPECPLCHASVSRDHAFFPSYDDGLDVDAVRAMFHPPAFHWDCYLAWPGRTAFAAQLFNRLVADLDRSTVHGRTYIDHDVAIFMTVYEPFVICVIVRETGRKLAVSASEWSLWQSRPNLIAPECHAIERQVLQDVLPRVWQRFPTLGALVSGTNWTDTERNLYASD